MKAGRWGNKSQAENEARGRGGGENHGQRRNPFLSRRWELGNVPTISARKMETPQSGEGLGLKKVCSLPVWHHTLSFKVWLRRVMRSRVDRTKFGGKGQAGARAVEGARTLMSMTFPNPTMRQASRSVSEPSASLAM